MRVEEKSVGVGRGGEGEGSAEDTRTSTKRASNKGWKHEVVMVVGVYLSG